MREIYLKHSFCLSLVNPNLIIVFFFFEIFSSQYNSFIASPINCKICTTARRRKKRRLNDRFLLLSSLFISSIWRQKENVHTVKLSQQRCRTCVESRTFALMAHSSLLPQLLSGRHFNTYSHCSLTPSFPSPSPLSAFASTTAATTAASSFSSIISR